MLNFLSENTQLVYLEILGFVLQSVSVHGSNKICFSSLRICANITFYIFPKPVLSENENKLHLPKNNFPYVYMEQI